MQQQPWQMLEKLDPKLMNLVEETRQLAFSDGAVPKKFKLLIALALQAAGHADEGVKSFAQMAIKAGATKEEIVEVLRINQYINGIGSVVTASLALGDVL